MKNSLKILIFCLFPTISFAQLPSDNKLEAQLQKEIYGGITLATNGWGLNFQYGKQKSLRYKVLYGLNISSIHHEKEHKTSNGGKNNKPYYYGKLNSLIAIRPFYGGKLTLFEKKRENAVEIDFAWATGLSLGLLKPVHLKIIELDTTDYQFHNVDERYNPTKDYPENILGRSGWLKGLGQAKLLSGLYFRAGINFDITTRRYRLFGLEIGVQADVYFKQVPLMYIAKNHFIFPSFYLNIGLGGKFGAR